MTDCTQHSAESKLLSHYRRIECQTVQMLGAAQLDDWQGVRRCESKITELARELEQAKSDARLLPGEDRERLRILRRLVIADAEVRRLADPRSRRIDAMLTSRRGAQGFDRRATAPSA